MRGDQTISKAALQLATSCSDQIVQIRWSDLPLACPMPGTTLWNGHPRVYMPIHLTGRELCPWCGTVYILQPPQPGDPEPELPNLEIAKCYERALQKAATGALPGKTDALTQGES